MLSLIEKIDSLFYPTFQANWDDHLFREKILSHLQGNFIILDLGAGAGIVEQMNFRGVAAKVCGVDLDPRVTANPMLDDGRIGDVGTIPYDDEEFDVVFADNVVEHLSSPDEVFREVFRVLKPGGIFLFKTPNKWHYMPTIARSTPHSFHRFVNRLRGRAEVDTFPTLYLANTLSAIRRLSRDVGFSFLRGDCIEGRPEYLRLFWFTYLIGVVYERLVNSTDWLSAFRILLVCELKKPSLND